MKLGPRQIIGLVAIVVFGGILIFRLTQPSERQVIADRIASLPSTSDLVQIPDLPPIDIPSVTGPALNTTTPGGGDRPVWELTGIDYINTGSQAAKDDLYCGGVLNAEFNATVSTAHPDKSSLLLRDAQALEKAGVARLVAEGKATEDAWAGFTLAWGDKAETDYTADTLRIPVADCSARAAALK